MKLLKFGGFVLKDGPHGYQCNVRGDVKHFVSVMSWVDYVIMLTGTKYEGRRTHPVAPGAQGCTAPRSVIEQVK